MDKKLSRGLRNNNPFNIKKSNNNWIGKIKGTDKDFETFDTLEHGYRAGLVLLRTYYRNYKLYNYRDILNRFAPPSENNYLKYISYIMYHTNIAPDMYISLETLLRTIAPLIATYESGHNFCTLSESAMWQPLCDKLLNK